MLNKIQNNLAGSTGYCRADYGAENGEDDYSRVPVNQLRQNFNAPPAPAQLEEEEVHKTVRELRRDYNKLAAENKRAAVRSRQRPASHDAIRPPWQKPIGGDTEPPAEPGWTPGAPKPPRQVTRPVQAPVNRVRAPPPSQVAPDFIRQPQRPELQGHLDVGKPAWIGTLKSSGGPKPWENREAASIAEGGPSGIPPAPQQPVPVHQPRVQNVHYGPGGDPTYQQTGDSAASDTAHVAHLQYNTPIGLYSRDNVEEVLKGQTGGRPGEGTLQVSGGNKKAFDPSQSAVLRALQEEESWRAKPRGYGLRPQGEQPPPPQPQQQPKPAQPSPTYQQPSHHGEPQQSPMMHLLENQMADQEGTSDF